MTADQSRRHAMLVRVRDFAQAHRARYAHVAVAVQQVAALDAAVRVLDECHAAQFAAGRGGTAARTSARTALLAELTRISGTARIVAMEAPGADLFSVPRFRTDQTLLALGRLFVREAGPLTEHFVGLGMAPAFVADLQVLVERFEHTVRASDAGKNARISARVGVTVALAQATAAVRRLDVAMVNACGRDTLLMAQWQRARWVGSRRRRIGRRTSDATRPDALAPSVGSRGAPTRVPPGRVVEWPSPGVPRRATCSPRRRQDRDDLHARSQSRGVSGSEPSGSSVRAFRCEPRSIRRQGPAGHASGKCLVDSGFARSSPAPCGPQGCECRCI